ncbi:uncharacterized protein KIAA1143 homolog isoform X1 [Hydra vulgaris]|uniref:uncharacterized protein KIAA1143 homolog isoform X1 n=1 Tax=Hydra vulgaris TaxID=6087 RepID=UPI0001924B61|nr:uncharacterized protein KIAA1143 homolog [Hydra vulgaris]
MAGSGKDNIQSIKQELPKFIREFKARTGQSERPSIDEKKSNSVYDEDDKIRDDEAPLIELSEKVSKDEAAAFLKSKFGQNVIIDSKKRSYQLDELEGCKNLKDDDSKLTFRQPTNRKEPTNKKKKSEMKQVKNSKLLSFGCEEDENEEGENENT